MTWDWISFLKYTAPVLVASILKFTLDLKIAPYVVKYLYWCPLRNYFRDKPLNISGTWEQVWSSAGSINFVKDTERHSHPEIKQLASYVYGEFFSKGVKYIIFGRVINNYLVGEWYDQKDPLGYFGTFQLLIKDSNTMKGKWIGHSKCEHIIKGDDWTWEKLS